jgi:hypothetical protein
MPTHSFFTAPHIEEEVTAADRPEVVVCVNRLEDESEVDEVLLHELTHAYDHCVFKRDLTK